MKLRLLSLFVSFLLTTALYAEYFKHIGLSEGITQPSVMAIYQDQLGRMWFGTREGINLYDGNQMKVFKGWTKLPGNAPSVWLGNEVSFIAGDRQGDIYFLIENDLIKYNIQTEQFIRLSEGHHIQALTSYEDDVWYMRYDSLFCRKPNEPDPTFVLKTEINSSIICLTLLDDKICIGTRNGAYLFDRATKSWDHILKGIEVYRIFESSQKELWLGTRMQGLYRMKKDGELAEVPYMPGSSEGISSQQIREFVEDNEGNIWFGTFDGLQKYSSDTQQYSLIQIPRYVGGLNHPSIFSLYKDIQGTIWIGSYFGGVNYFTPQHESFVHYDYGNNATKNVYYSYIGDIILDKDEHVWLSTDGGGISCTDKNWNMLQQFTAGGSNSLPHNNIKSVCYDEKNNCLYIGTYLGGLSRYDIDAKRFHNYLKPGLPSLNMPNEVVFHVKMWKGQVYISARNGVFRLDTRTQKFHKLNVPNAYYQNFDISPDGYLYLAGWNAVYHMRVDQPDSIARLSLEQSGCDATPTRLLATSEGVYIGTLGSGLFFYDRQKHKLTHYTQEKTQLPSNYCYNICRTQDGKILITSDKGVTCFTPGKETFTTIDLMSNFPSAHIINGCGILPTTNGRIFVGDTQGVTVLSEDEFNKSDLYNDESNLYFSELWVNNQIITPGDKTGVLSHSLPYTRRLELSYDQNNLIVRFALSNYAQQLSEQWFQYKLEGFDKKWIKTKQTELHYTNLNPGTYTLHIEAINQNGVPNGSKEITMQLVIASPWYNTWWAWAIYIIICTTFIFYYVFSKMAKQRLALSLEKERFEKQQIERLNQEKLVFFTNVSHEFRTPLTLIISHIDILLQKHSLNPSIYNQILKIKKNAQKMNNLISELLEFRKLEQNHETLSVKQQDVILFLKEIYFSFADYAHQREITYTFGLPETPVLCWFDSSLLEKVFFNLLSNAFKYTSNGGSITLSGEITDDAIRIHISDTGIGISEQDATRIFTRFFQGNNQEKNGSLFSGTGIGLALSKTIIDKHHGEITVQSEIGQGSTFTVTLQRRKDVFLSDENVRLAAQEPETAVVPGSLPVLPDGDSLSAEPAGFEDMKDKSHTLLLVEDNEELLQVLVDLFSPFYQIKCAHNGKEGLNQVYENKPDLIISDIMMPEMTGTEMCLQLKNNIDFCHIPIILLTALNSTEQNIEGLNRGADDYITKPFHAQLLLARANNLIRSRLLMQHQFDKKPISEIDLTSINPLDKDVLKRTVQIIEQHIDDTEFDVSVLCREIGISRSLLYTKFKALTGMTPNTFILNFRLKHAAALLQQYPDIPISEVSDRTGFSTPVYFSRCFKNQYGCTPQGYQKEKKAEKR